MFTGTVWGRLAMALFGLLLMGFTFEAVRRSKLLERYAILWFATALVTILCAAFPFLPNIIVHLMKISFLEAASLIIFFFFLLVIFNISLAISRIQTDEHATARKTALLEAELEQLRRECETLKGRLNNDNGNDTSASSRSC